MHEDGIMVNHKDPHPKIEIYDRASAQEVADRIVQFAPKFPDTSAPYNDLMRKWKLTEDFPSSRRLIKYEDSARIVIFRATRESRGKFTLDDALEIPKKNNPDETSRITSLFDNQFVSLHGPLQIQGQIHAPASRNPGQPTATLDLPAPDLARLQAGLALHTVPSQELPKPHPEGHVNATLPTQSGSNSRAK